jgi:cytochrome d ubiquinol oxidase subunit I
MEVTSFREVLFNPVAQAKFVHTVSAGYVTASAFVLGVSAIMLLRGKWPRVAKRSFVVAAAFGLASSLSVVVLGDESGYTLTDNQKMKLAALEAMWRTEPAPAGLDAFGLPSLKDHQTHAEVKIPYVLGLIATRSIDKPVVGIFDLVTLAQTRIGNGVKAYDALERLKADPSDRAARAAFELTKRDLGYGLLLKRYVSDPRTADAATIEKAAWDTVPNVPVMFWIFRVMAAIGFLQIAVFAAAFILASLRRCDTRWILWAAVAIMPLPWIAVEAGWVLAEIGRQPWAVDGVLPTFLGASSLTVAQLWTTIAGFSLLYSALIVVEAALIVRTVKRGPYAHAERAEPAPEAVAALVAE